MSDIFNAEPTPDGGSFDQNRPLIDPNKNYLEELVGDGKKFRSHEDLARGKAESDLFIAKLLQEKKEALEELNKRLTVEDLLSRLENKGTPPVTQNQFNQNGNAASGDQNAPNSNLNLDEIKAAVKAELERDVVNAKREANVNNVNAKMTELYGDQAPAVLRRKAQELGVSIDYLRGIAADSPALFLKTIEEAPVAQPQKPSIFNAPPQGVNTGALPKTPTYGNHKPRSYYENLKKTNPKEYFSPKTAVQEHKDAVALGVNFFDT